MVTLDMERMKYLLRDPDTVKGKIILSEYESFSNEVTNYKYVTGTWGQISAVQEQENKKAQTEPMFYMRLSNWDAGKEAGNNYREIMVVYNADLSRMLIKDEKYWKIYFCSEKDTDLEDLLAYFGGEYEISQWLQQNGKN